MPFGNIWDYYQNMQQTGWTPPAGIEGQPQITTTGGNAAWRAAQGGNQGVGAQPSIPDTGMMDLMNAQRTSAPNLQNQGAKSYFPNAVPQAAGQPTFNPPYKPTPVNQAGLPLYNPPGLPPITFQSKQRPGTTTYNLPQSAGLSGGSINIPSRSRIPSAYLGYAQPVGSPSVAFNRPPNEAMYPMSTTPNRYFD